MKLITLLPIVLLSACSLWPTGDDPEGRDLKSQGVTVLKALGRFEHDNGSYPASMAELVPGYLPKLPSSKIRFGQKTGSVSFSYSPTWPKTGQVLCSAENAYGGWACADAL